MAAASAGDYGYTSSQAAQAALYAEMFTNKCETGFLAIGLQNGEAVTTPIRVICTLITVSVASAWFNRRKSIKSLLLFFSHWLSGLLHELTLMFYGVLILVCWTEKNLLTLIKILKFIELTSSNMLAITNLAICVNLALIVMSHRSLSRVKSVSSPRLVFLFLVVSIGATAISAAFWETAFITGTGFWFSNEDERATDWITVSTFYIEFFVGMWMLLIVVYLLVFRMEDIKECWKIHARIRYYFGLTLIGTAVNLALGVCGIAFICSESRDAYLIVLTWAFRYVHIALDTIVLYGVLGSRNMSERPGSLPDASGPAATSSGGSGVPPKRRPIGSAVRGSTASSRYSSSIRRVSLSSGHSVKSVKKPKVPPDGSSNFELPLQWD